jgi:valacyclovir hydrolase
VQYQVPVPGGRIAAHQLGSGPPVVLVHGGTSTAAIDWEPILDTLAARFTVILYDQRGHGRSTGFTYGIGMDRFGMDLLHVMRWFGLPAAGLVGFSVGGNSLLKLLVRVPWVARALVTIGSATYGEPDRVNRIMTGPWPDVLTSLEHDDAEDADHWRRIRAALASDWAANLDISPDHAARVTCPALICHGDGDRIQTLEQALGLARMLPDARLFVVPGAGHMAQVDQPRIVGPVVADFLAEALSRP